MTETRDPFVKDVAASVLYFSAAQALIPLSAFIAANRFAAPPVLVGAMITGAYFGYIWNLFFSRAMARLDLRMSIVVLMLVSSILLVATGLQRTAVSFCLFVLAYLVCYGLGSVQYNSMIKHLYSDNLRVRRLSFRFAAVSGAAMLLAVAFGRLSITRYQVVFFAAAAASVAAAAVFRLVRVGPGARMISFSPAEVLGVFRESPPLRFVAFGLGIYGVVGSALHIPLTYLYTALGFTEGTVGSLSAVRVGATVLAALLVTPRVRQRGGFANFRIAFLAASAAVLVFFSAGLFDSKTVNLVLLIVGNCLFGVSAAGFQVALQTTAIQLAPEGRTTLYVNALMIVFGVRGLFWPIAVGFAMQFVGPGPMFLLCLAAAAGCFGLTFLRGARATMGGTYEGKTEHLADRIRG